MERKANATIVMDSRRDRDETRTPHYLSLLHSNIKFQACQHPSLIDSTHSTCQLSSVAIIRPPFIVRCYCTCTRNGVSCSVAVVCLRCQLNTPLFRDLRGREVRNLVVGISLSVNRHHYHGTKSTRREAFNAPPFSIEACCFIASVLSECPVLL